MLDKVKIIASLLLLFAGIVGYYQLPTLMGADVSILLRVGLLLVSIVLAFVVAINSEYGASALAFAKGSRTELRKMIWPTRPETIQTTMIVLVLVVLVSLFLWLVDATVFNVIYDWLLGLED